MFTGIIQALAPLRSLSRGEAGARLELEPPPGWRSEAGESVAVNGCCLTALPGGGLAFDLSPETLKLSSLGGLAPGQRVNLERALKAGQALGGHFVAGHVDGLAELLSAVHQGGGSLWRLRCPPELAPYVASKGSLALDGVSLTPHDVSGAEFSVSLIPHTLAASNLGERAPGARLNLEVDLLARYLRRFLELEKP